MLRRLLSRIGWTTNSPVLMLACAAATAIAGALLVKVLPCPLHHSAPHQACSKCTVGRTGIACVASGCDCACVLGDYQFCVRPT